MKKLVLIIIGLILIAGFTSARDLRAVKLQKFLDRYPWSPLRGHEQEILYCADKFGLDYRLYIAIAGAESTYGKKYPQGAKNLTGYGIYGDNVSKFSSIYQNIYKTHELIATKSYYKKFRATKDIKDLIRVYKGVPPYEHYFNNMRYALDQITAVSIVEELKEQRLKLARLDPASKKLKINKEDWVIRMFSWVAVRYDKHEIEKENKASLKFAPM